MNVARLVVGFALVRVWSMALAQTGPLFNVREYGAKGDGIHLDTPAIHRAIDDCHKAGGGQVLFPPGWYLSGTIHLRDNLTLFLSPGSRLVGSTNLAEYASPDVPDFMPEATWGKWHRALVLGQNCTNVTITGGGILDGNKVFDATGEERMRGPHTVLFVNCRNFDIRDISILDAANYGIFFQLSDDIRIDNVRFVGGWDGIHFRGAPQRWCHAVTITGCQFYTGDDSIAGRYWDNTLIKGCIINSSCNGIRLIGPATRLIVSDCLFYGPGKQPHRTSGRTNMLSGIILQPGAWDSTQGLLDDVLISRNTMKNVASPVTLWAKTGNTVGRVTISNLDAEGVYRSAFSAESWSESPITNVILRNVSVEFIGGGTAEQAQQVVRAPGVDARGLPAWGLYARNVNNVLMQDVRLSLGQDDLRPVIAAETVNHLCVEGFRHTVVPQVQALTVLTNVMKVTIQDADVELLTR
jgi:polygalacturonase